MVKQGGNTDKAGREHVCTHMVNVNFSFVHELHQTLDVHIFDIFHDEYGILFLVLGQYRVEVGAACGQDDLVGLDGPALARQRDIAEGLPLEQLGEHRLKVGMVVPPSQAILLGQHDDGDVLLLARGSPARLTFC